MCLRFESRIDPSEAAGFLLALISYLPDAPFIVEVSKEQASLILRLAFLYLYQKLSDRGSK